MNDAVGQEHAQDLERLFGVPAGLIVELAASGVLPVDVAGSCTPEASQRLRLVRLALDRGVTRDALTSLLNAYGSDLSLFDELVPAPLTGLGLGEAARQVGLPTAAGGVASVAGWEGTGPADENDMAAMLGARQALDGGLPPEALVQLLRVYEDSLQRLADAQNRVFHDYVHDRLKAEGLTGPELLQAAGEVGGRLRQLVEPTLLYFHRRAWRTATQRDFIRHLAEVEAPAQPAGQLTATVVFIDLTSFTPLTERMGDDAAAAVISAFSRHVRTAVYAHHGRIVKQLGDGVMVLFDDPDHALAAGTEVFTLCSSEPNFPQMHAGAHTGELLFRDGDYVGSAANIASRVAGQAAAGSFLITSSTRAHLNLAHHLTPAGDVHLKGIRDPIHLWAVPQRPGGLRGEDPVCHMQVDMANAVRLTVATVDYYFCSNSCRDQFRDEAGLEPQ